VEVSVSGQGAGQNDPVVSMRSAIKSDGTNVYEYVLLYTNDALSIGVEAGLIFGTRLDQCRAKERDRMIQLSR
jgi:hypothetical protein